eukprot:scaffold1954_cov268-Pinguiococcus_pyrenoidosus.AAC.171
MPRRSCLARCSSTAFWPALATICTAGTEYRPVASRKRRAQATKSVSLTETFPTAFWAPTPIDTLTAWSPSMAGSAKPTCCCKRSRA